MLKKLVPMVSAFLSLLAFSGCSDSEPLQSFTTVRNEMETLTRTHSETALRLSSPDALREETRQYSETMRGCLADMQDLCNQMGHGDSMMGGHDGQDMMNAIGDMSDAMEQHREHMEELDDVEAMHEECLAYRQAFMHHLDELDGAMHGSGHMGR